MGGHRGIIIPTDERGRPSGDAYVEVETMDDLDLALKMHKRDLGSRWVWRGAVVRPAGFIRRSTKWRNR